MKKQININRNFTHSIIGCALLTCIAACSLVRADGIMHPPIDTALAHDAMQRGMNFGNVFTDDAATTPWGSPTAWVSTTPETLESMADLYYEKGFKLFRIPFTWSTIIDNNTTSGVFDDTHLKFTKFVGLIDYILDTYPDAYVMINSHHDRWHHEDPWPTHKTLFGNLWVNIATYFHHYDFRLILEIDNESFHNVNDGTGTHANTIDLMQTGWNAIRGTGSNNVNRIIMIAPLGGQHYALNGTYGSIAKVNEVTGGDNDHVIMTIHHYGPFPFCGANDYVSGTRGEGTTIDYATTQSAMIGFAQWSQTMGIPVNVGEFGVAWRYAGRYEDGNLRAEPTAKQIEWFNHEISLMEGNGLSYNVWDDNGWFRVLDRASLRFTSLIQFADSTTLVGGAIRNGDFNAAPPGDQVSFADTPFWQNIQGTNQTFEATRTNLTFDGSVAAVQTHYTTHAVDTGHTLANGEVFDLHYVWRDAWQWNDAHDQLAVSLYVTGDNTLTGTRTNLITDLSGLSTMNDTFEAVDRPAFYMADASHVGRRLFMAISTDYDGDGNALSRVDNVVLKVQLPLATWKARSFTQTELQNSTISGNAADPNGNGRPNLLEFIQQSDPTASHGEDASKDPAIQFDGSAFKLRFVEHKQLKLMGITRTFKGSSDHTNFTSMSPLSTNVVSENLSTQTLEVELPASGERYFYKVEYAP